MRIWPAGCLGIFFLTAFAQAADNGTVTPGETPAVTQLTRDYLDGKWDAVSTSLRDHAGDFSVLPPEKGTERADVNTIRQAFAECRQAWWAETKPGNKILIHPSVWGRPFDATYDPTGKSSVTMESTAGVKKFSLTWKPDDMDSDAKGEHGFSKGEIAELGIWMTMGNMDGWTAVQQDTLTSNSEAGRTSLARWLDFRSAVTGAYYGSPRVRRWALFLYLNTYESKYAAMETAMSRKTIGAMMVAEVVGNPARYPSIKLPTGVIAESGAELKCVEQIKGWIEKHGWTLAEDKSLREALKQFGLTNSATTYRSGMVSLPNKLFVSLDPDRDKQYAAKRDAWLVKQLAKDAAAATQTGK